MKYGGKLIHRVRDAHGSIEVVDGHGVRSLHFESAARQSAIDLMVPDRIELAYLRSMLSALLFVPKPKRILLLGLGGGTLARFFSRHFLDAEIVVVELRQAVVDIARRYFLLEAAPSLSIHVMDANDFLREHVSGDGGRPFDLLIVDIFDGEGPSVLLQETCFLYRLRDVLSPEGVMALNLWAGDDTSWRPVQKGLRDVFGGYLGALPVPGRGNRICLAHRDPLQSLSRRALVEVAQDLERRLGFEFIRMLDRIEFSASI